MKWLEEIPYLILIAASVLMAMLPMQPEPHLVEKMRMLQAGELNKLIDIFDVLWHSFPAILLLLKMWMQFRHR